MTAALPPDDYAWSMTDDSGDVMTASQAQARLCEVIADPQLAQRYLNEMARVDLCLPIAALMVNPEMREQVWDQLDEQLRFYYVISDRPVKDRAGFIARTVADAVRYYHDPLAIEE